MKKKLIISLIILICSLILTISAVAYFSFNSANKNITITPQLNTDLIEVSNYDELFYYSKDKNYNDSNDFNTVDNNIANRKTLFLTENIILKADLEITANINLDLNGKYLYLNGKNITFNHGYYGTVQIYSNVVNGHIVPEEIVEDNDSLVAKENGLSGKIIINCPNSIVTNNLNLVFENINGISLDKANYFNVLEMNSLYYSYLALYNVSDSLVDYTDIRIEKLALDSLSNNQLISESNSIYNFDSKLFISQKELDSSSYCQFDLNNIHNCTYLYEDLYLPFNYLNYKDITIEYESSNPEILSNFGKFVAPSVTTDVTLKAIIKLNGEEVAESSFLLHAINPESSDMIKAAKSILISRLKDHYDVDDDIYSIDREILLPSVFGNVSISYLPYKESTQQGSVDLLNDGTTYLSLSTSSINKFNNYLIDFAPTSETKLFAITFTIGNNNETIYIKCSSENLIVNNESSVCRDVINDWYGGKISLDKIDEDNNVYDTQLLYAYEDINLTNYPGITSLSYEIINDSHNLYQLNSVANSNRKTLSVVSGKIPEAYVQDVLLSCVFEINEKTINIQINIAVNVASVDGNSAFLPYFTYYDEIIKSKYNNYISSTFELPIAYSNEGPIIIYDFAIIPSNYDSLEDKTLTNINPLESKALKVKLYYNGSVRTTLTYQENTSYSQAFDTYLGSTLDERINKLNEILAYGDAKWIFDLNIEDTPNSNTNLALIYNYKMTSAVSGWTTYCANTGTEQLFTKILLAGVLHYGSDVIDETFYKWIFDNYSTLTDSTGNKVTYTLEDYTSALTSSSEGHFVLIDWLTQNVSIDAANDNVISTITDFTGLQFLIGCRYLSLTDSSNNGLITDSTSAIKVAQEISKMINLETLILNNCTGFSDGYDVTSNNVVDNDSISRFVNLRNLNILEMNGCNIILFNCFDDLTWLNELHVTDQVISSNNNYNNFYGNTGIANYWVFTDLVDAGVKVYTTKQGSAEILFENQKITNDYTRLKNGILYQSKLALGEDIRQLYADFSTNPDDYLLQNSYTYLSGSGTLTIDSNSRTITYSYVEYGLTSDITIDSNKTYYVKDSTQSSGYKAVVNPNVSDIATYYEHYDQTNAKAFEVIYHFELTGSTSVSINLIVKFKVERFSNE